jgi:putative zinc finger/helix-turn-helix YgiT family protein
MRPLGPDAVKQLIRSILRSGLFIYSKHSKEETLADDLTTVDCENVLRGGVVRPGEYEHGSWRYRVETNRITVVVAFRSERELVVVTAWRIKRQERREEAGAMKCPECGTAMRTKKERYRYDECGLKYVTLAGVEVNRCPRCGNHEVSIPHIEELHRLIARVLIEKRTRFRGEEVGFLRKSLGWSGADFAKHMGVTNQTVSRWENDAAPIGPQADRLLRLIVAQGRLTMQYPTERLARINPNKASATRVELETRGEQWELRSA